MAKNKQEQPSTVNNFYVASGGLLQNLNTNLTTCRPCQYDNYVFMFQSIMGEMALIKKVRLLHWRVIALLISRMEASGRIIFYVPVATSKLAYKSPRYVYDVINDLVEWNVIYRPNPCEENIYKFNQRFLFKGKVADNFLPFSEPQLFPQIGHPIGPQPRPKPDRIEPNLNFENETS